MSTTAPVTFTPQLAALRARIGVICHALRFAAAGYALWILLAVLVHWLDRDRLIATHGRLLRIDLTGMAPWQQAAGLAVDLSLWLLVAVACCAAWQLFTGYLEGRIFTTGAAALMRRTALFGIVAQVLGMAARPLVAAILSAHLPAGERHVHVFFQPNDLLTLLLLASLLALAHIQLTGAELAAENAEII